MNQTITFFEKSVYGVTRIYPKSDNAKILADLMDTVTFSRGELKLIEQLGYTVELIELPS